MWNAPRGENILDGGAPFYDVYETADGRWVSIAPIEAKFYSNLLEVLGLTGEALPEQWDRAGWPTLRERFTAIFRTRPRDAWCTAFQGRDACFAPVLEGDEITSHPQHTARNAFVDVAGLMQPAPTPRFSRTAPGIPSPTRATGDGGAEALSRWSVSDAEMAGLRDAGVIACT